MVSAAAVDVSERFDLIRKADVDETNPCQVPIRGMSASRTAAVGAQS